MATGNKGIGNWSEIDSNKSGYYSPTYGDEKKCPSNYTLRLQNYRTGINDNSSKQLPLYANVIKNQPFVINFYIDCYKGSYSSLSFNNFNIILYNGTQTNSTYLASTTFTSLTNSTINWSCSGYLYFGELFTVNTPKTTSVTLHLGGYISSVGQYYYTIYKPNGTVLCSKTKLTGNTMYYTGTIESLNDCIIVISSLRDISFNNTWSVTWEDVEFSSGNIYNNNAFVREGSSHVSISFGGNSGGGGTSTTSATSAMLSLGDWDDI